MIAATAAKRPERTRGCQVARLRPRRQLPLVDAVIVGGGPAGLSAALVLGRARKRVLVVDADRPANAVSNSIGGLLGQVGVAPAELRASGRKQLREHDSVELRRDTVVDVETVADGTAVRPGDGRAVQAPALILAHGLRYDPPPLPGIDGLWGRSVFHCPFCDGWEVRDRTIAVHGNGPDAVRSALNIAGWSRDVVLCTDGPAELGPGRAALVDAGIRVREEPIRVLVGERGQLTRIEFLSGFAEECDALFVRTDRGQPNGLAEALGCDLTSAGTVITDLDGRTSVAGVYAAGDTATEHYRSVANAIGSGSRAAYAVALDALASDGSQRVPTAAAA
jgi:thioredoxin reductase